MNKKLKQALAKKEADLTQEEKTLILEHAAELTVAEKAKFAKTLEDEEEDEDEEDEEEEDDDEEEEDDDKEKSLDLKSVKALVKGEMTDAFAKQFESVADKLVAKFMEGAKASRSKIHAKKEIEEKKDKKSDDVTREFLKALMDGDKARAKALSTSTSGGSPDDAKAGLLIPEELRNEVLRIAQDQYGLARRDMMYLPFSGPGNSRKIPTLGSSVSVFWTGEKVAKKSTQPKFNLVEQTLKKLAAIVPMSEEIIEDSLINLTQLVGALIAEAIAKEEDLQFFAGDGSPWTGVLNNGDVNIQYQTVAGVANLKADDLLNMIDKTPTGALPGSKFYMNRTVLSVIRKLKDLQGNYIYQNPGQGLPATIWNYPVELSDAFPTASAVEAGSPYILFGNLQKTCIFGDKQQIRTKLLEEATIHDTDWTEQGAGTAINLAEQDMVALRIVERVGYLVGLPEGLTVLDAGTAESES